MNLDDLTKPNNTAHKLSTNTSFADLCKPLSRAEQKRVMKDVQYELPSALMFYMGIGKDKQTLIILDNFSTLPISLARVCEHVIVHGLEARDTQLLNAYAELKEVTNFSSVDEIDTLATKFDLIIIIQPAEAGKFEAAIQKIRKFIHPDTEIWTIAAKGLAPANIKAQIRSVFRTSTSEDQSINGSTLTLATNQVSPNLRLARSQFKKIGCQPFSYVGLTPSFANMRMAKPINGSVHQLPPENEFTLLEKLATEEIAIGAAERQLTQSFITRILDSLPGSSLSQGRLIDYHVAPGGKVLINAEYSKEGKPHTVMVKLPLNDIALKREKINHMILSYLKNSESAQEMMRNRIPDPFAEGKLENQPYFAESKLEGVPGHLVKGHKKKPEEILIQIFPFWLALQRRFIKKVRFDEQLFQQHVQAPVQHAFKFLPDFERNADQHEQILGYLREVIIDKEISLSLIHGDFSVKNILFDPRSLKISGVIDWDMARMESFPIFDLFHFVLRLQKSSFRNSKIKLLIQIIKQDRSYRKVANMYEDAFAVNKELQQALTIVYWAHRLAWQVGSLKYLDRQFVERNYLEPLKLFGQFKI